MPPKRPTPAIDIGCERLHPILEVPDIHAAVKFWTEKLGFWCAFTWPEKGAKTFAGVNLGDVQVMFNRGTHKIAGSTGISFIVSDADALFAFHNKNGVEITEPIADREYGLRDYGVLDGNGFNLSFGHYIYNTGEPIEIERVDVPVRLEKRLAALLVDLAEYKRLSLASTLEEILLHTNEPGQPGPHTEAQSRHIQKLKQKHGIDYDSHGSYRFVEKKKNKGK